MRLINLILVSALMAAAGDTGIAPRSRASDYPVHQEVNSATFAAALVPAQQVERMFSADVAKLYVVVETAIYPENGQLFEVKRRDFSLKLGSTMVPADDPDVVAAPWQGQTGIPPKPLTVVSQTGVVYTRTNDPAYGRRTEVGTYEGVAVTNDPQAVNPPPPPKPGPDPQVVEQRVRDRMLPEGQTRIAVAGYLFLSSVRHKAAQRRFDRASLVERRRQCRPRVAL